MRLCTYVPEKAEKKAALPSAADPSCQALPAEPGEADNEHLEGITLRRVLKMEPMNRQRETVYIEKELLERVPGDLNFQINLALEHIITKHCTAQVAVSKLDD